MLKARDWRACVFCEELKKGYMLIKAFLWHDIDYGIRCVLCALFVYGFVRTIHVDDEC